MSDFANDDKIIVDDIIYHLDDLTEFAKSQVINIRFSDERISQLRNELAISTTARAGYLKFLNAGSQKDTSMAG